jgi:hypothetical protein
MAARKQETAKGKRVVQDLDPKASNQVIGGDGRDTKRYDRMMELLSSVAKKT